MVNLWTKNTLHKKDLFDYLKFWAEQDTAELPSIEKWKKEHFPEASSWAVLQIDPRVFDSRAVAWIEDEVEQWIESRIEERDSV